MAAERNDTVQTLSHDEILTLTEVAEYLKVSEKSVRRMVQRGEIPCAKIASQWRFSRTVIDDWLISQMKVLPQNDLTRLMEMDNELVPISRIVRREHIVENIRPGSKADVLAQLIRPLAATGIVTDSETYLAKLVIREEMVSTAIGNGIAIPHIRNIHENPAQAGPVIVIGVCPEGTDFAALDRKPSFLFFLTLTDSEVVHLRLLAKLSRLFKAEGSVNAFIECDRDPISLIMEMEEREILSRN